MTLPQRSPAPAHPRPVAYGQRALGRPVVPAARPPAQHLAAQHAAGVRTAGGHPGTGHPMPSGAVLQRPAPRAVSFLTVTEVAAIMRVSKMTVYRLVHGGELAAVRVGRSFRVPEPAVRDYLSGARTDVA